MAARDIIFSAVILFSFAVLFYASFHVLNLSFSTMINDSQINQSSGAVDALTASKALTNRFDYIIFAVFIALVLGIIITGWFVGGNAIFMFIYFIIIVIAAVLSAVLSNAWETISIAAGLGGNIGSFPITNNIMINLPLYISIIGFLGLVAMFAKPFVRTE